MNYFLSFGNPIMNFFLSLRSTTPPSVDGHWTGCSKSSSLELRVSLRLMRVWSDGIRTHPASYLCSVYLREITAMVSIVLPVRLPCARSICIEKKEETLRWTLKLAHFTVHLSKNLFLFSMRR